MSVSSNLLCSFELLKPLDSSALKSHIKRGRNARQNMLNSPVCDVPIFKTDSRLTVDSSLHKYLLKVTKNLAQTKSNYSNRCCQGCLHYVRPLRAAASRSRLLTKQSPSGWRRSTADFAGCGGDLIAFLLISAHSELLRRRFGVLLADWAEQRSGRGTGEACLEQQLNFRR